MVDNSTQSGEVVLVDLYRTPNPNEAEFIVDMLRDNDIVSYVRHMEVSAFPMHTGDGGMHRVVAEQERFGDARALIELAIQDNAITKEGAFLENL